MYLGRMALPLKSAESHLNRFLNEIDRYYLYSRRIRAGKRLPRLVFKHGGVSGENVHFHGVIIIEGNLLEAVDLCQTIWDRLTHASHLDRATSQFVVAQSVKSTSFYSAGEVIKLGYEDSWMIDQSCITNPRSKEEREIENTRKAELTALQKKLRLSSI